MKEPRNPAPPEQPRPAETPPPAPKKHFKLIKLEDRANPSNPHTTGYASSGMSGSLFY
jgi:hypothetical protein